MRRNIVKVVIGLFVAVVFGMAGCGGGDGKTSVESTPQVFDTTYTDPQTGLMWVRNGKIAGGAMNWSDAMNWVNNLNYAGYSDWRLPTSQELDPFALRGITNQSDWFNINGFQKFPDYYWTTTISPNYAYDGYIMTTIMSGSGSSVGAFDKSTSQYVWPVRNTTGAVVFTTTMLQGKTATLKVSQGNFPYKFSSTGNTVQVDFLSYGGIKSGTWSIDTSGKLTVTLTGISAGDAYPSTFQLISVSGKTLNVTFSQSDTPTLIEGPTTFTLN